MTESARVASIAVGAGVVLALAPFVGSQLISPAEIFDSKDSLNAVLFWRYRVPRVLLAFLAGAGLSLAGLAFQALFRNPLATPFTLGISSGAALGAVLSVRLGLVVTWLGIATTTASAFVGALVSILIVYGLTSGRRGYSTAVMLLAGVAVNFFFSSLILFVQFTSDVYDSFRILRWLMGGIVAVGYDRVLEVAPFVFVGGAVFFCLPRELNLLTTGDDLAVSRGLDLRRTRRWIFLAASLIVGGVVSACGPVGFVGMMAPHIARLIVGSDHRHLVPASLLFGGGFLVVCNTFARTVMAPTELPVGVVTAFLGGPFFLWLLLRGRGDKGRLFV